jgi:hypothetical protein
MARRLIFLAGSCLLLAACASSRAPAAAPRSVDAELGAVPAVAARVCIVRPADVAGDVTMEVRDNKRLVGATRGSTFVCWLAAPGRHQITSVDDDTGPTFLEARAGRHYWLHQDVTTLFGAIHAHLDWIDDSAAAEMLDACSARVRVSIPGHDDRQDAVAVTPAL